MDDDTPDPGQTITVSAEACAFPLGGFGVSHHAHRHARLHRLSRHGVRAAVGSGAVSGDAYGSPIVEVTMLMADAAQVADGKLFVLGGGLQLLPARPQPVAIALLLKVPWDRANLPHEWKLELLDEDGMPVFANDRPVLVAGQFEAGRPAGWPPGTPLQVPLAINFSAVPVRPGGAYTWRLAVDDTSEPSWRVGFRVAPAPVTQA